MNTARKTWLAAGLAAGLTLAGCWGDSDDAPAAVAGNGIDVPDSAAASSSAFLVYLQALSATDESFEPSAISTSFEVPPDDVSEPAPLL